MRHACSRAALLALQVSEWRFDVFEFMKDPLIGGKPLAPVTLTVLRAHGLLDGWRLDRSVTIAYLEAVEEAYLANAYHNNIHAADVVQVRISRDNSVRSAAQPVHLPVRCKRGAFVVPARRRCTAC